MGALIWLASYPKSGNTWVRAFLHNFLRDTGRPADINELDKFCLGESHAAWYQRHLDRPLIEASEEDIARIRPLGQADFTQAFPDSVFVKTHNYLGEWHGVPLHNMDVTTGAIYVVRNPLDVVLSMTHHFNLDIDGAIDRLGNEGSSTEATLEHIPEMHASWSTHVKSWTAHTHAGLLVMRYEDMLEKPRKHFRRLVSFLGINPPKARLERAIHHSSFKSLQKQEKEHSFKERSEYAEAFFRSGTHSQWRKHLSKAQVQRIVSEHYEQMKRFGYIPRGYENVSSA
ncbi:MAG: sulfotransferase domain-containing protein [Parvularculales bacterium]